MKGRTSLVIAHRLSTILAAMSSSSWTQAPRRAGHARAAPGQGGLYASLYETHSARREG